MIRITPELYLHSALDGDSTENLSRELDFNLARRSAVIINRIVSQMFVHVDVLTGNEIAAIGIQEVDLDPDNAFPEFGGVAEPNAVVIDSSRVLRHYAHTDRDTATGGGSQGTHPLLVKDWANVPDNMKPISITNIRHHLVANAALSNILHGEINIDYFIAELSLSELGLLNASRR